MTITIDRKRKESILVFPKIDDFINYLKVNYNKINFKNNKIKSSIKFIYNKLINDDGNVKYLRLTRWLPKQFGFKKSNILTLDFWIERGFCEEDYLKYTSKKFKENSERLIKKSKSKLKDSYIYEKSYSSIFYYNSYKFNSDELPSCNSCGFDLTVKKGTKNNVPIYRVEKCSNKKCESNSTKSKDIKWFSYLPNKVYSKIKNNLKSIPRSFSKEFWINKGYTEEESIEKVKKIQSENSKKFKGKRTGKSKECLRKKGYTEEQIRKVCLSELNVEYWTDRGYTEKEAKNKISKKQKHASSFVDHEKRLLPSNIEYWLNKGYSEKESKLKVKESQTTFSKEICIKKYGYEKGMEVFNKRQQKWFESLKNNGNIFIGYSKISQQLFDEISNRIIGNFKYATNNGEYKIKRKSGGYYFYDFTDVVNKKIIEYNGDMYHANPKKFNENDNPHPFRKNITSKEIWKNDKIKLDLAIKEGFEILIIWDSEYRYKGKQNKESLIQKCIDFLTNKKI